MKRVATALLYAGTVGIVVILAKVHAELIGKYSFTGSSRFAWTVAYIILLCVLAYGAGLPDLLGGRPALSAALAASAASAIVMSLFQLILGSAVLPRFVVFGAALGVVPWFTLCAAVASGGQGWQADRARVLAVVTREEAGALMNELSHAPERPASVACALSVDEAVGLSSPLILAATTHRATLLVLDRAAQAEASVVAQAAELHMSGLRVRSLTRFYDEFLGKLPLTELKQISLMFDVGEVHSASFGRIKRLIDLMVALLGMIAVVLVVPFVVVGNLVSNRGRLFFEQNRVGKDGRLFKIVKFRTMRPELDIPGIWTALNDPRTTPFGRILRRTHLDELPQMLNILRGDMSVVGPRPEQPQYVAKLVEKLPFYEFRHLVRPGLTGWAQVKYGYASSDVDTLEKLQYEFYYLRHQSLGLDLRIMGRTLRRVLRMAGR